MDDMTIRNIQIDSNDKIGKRDQENERIYNYGRCLPMNINR